MTKTVSNLFGYCRKKLYLDFWMKFNLRIVFCCRQLQDLITRCAEFGESNSVLLIGPRGSGKSLVSVHIT